MNPTKKALPQLTLTANTLEELNKLMSDMVNQGWQSDGAPVQNADGTYSVVMYKAP